MLCNRGTLLIYNNVETRMVHTKIVLGWTNRIEYSSKIRIHICNGGIERIVLRYIGT